MLRFGSLFSGVGLLDVGLQQAGIEHAWFCERDEWRRGIIAKRWPGAPVYDDVRTVGADQAAPVDGIVGGFPCKGASSAGKGEGFDHPETVLWREMARVVGELRPRYVVLENVANLLTIKKGILWQEVLETLAALGFDCRWECVRASDVGAAHRRDRVFLVAAHADGAFAERDAGQRRVADGWPDAGGGGQAASEAGGGPAQLRRGASAVRGAAGAAEGEGNQRQRGGDAAADRAEVAADASNGRRAAATDAGEPRGLGSDARPGAQGRGIAVEWGEYEPAVRRWEALTGPAPEPLVRRVDDGDAAVRRVRSRVDRHRLSALGDGVQVQVGRLVGEYVVWLDRQRRLQQEGETHA